VGPTESYGIMTNQEHTEADPPSRRLLVAEDNLLNQKLISAILRTAGYHFKIVENGRLAVEAMRDDPYDMVLMDLQMPEMDGVEATKAIRGELGRRDIPIIAVTAYLADVGRDRCRDAGVDDYVEKPFTREKLLSVVQRWLTRE
jgi:CheY-like chemotaxis protein